MSFLLRVHVAVVPLGPSCVQKQFYDNTSGCREFVLILTKFLHLIFPLLAKWTEESLGTHVSLVIQWDNQVAPVVCWNLRCLFVYFACLYWVLIQWPVTHIMSRIQRTSQQDWMKGIGSIKRSLLWIDWLMTSWSDHWSNKTRTTIPLWCFHTKRDRERFL